MGKRIQRRYRAAAVLIGLGSGLLLFTNGCAPSVAVLSEQRVPCLGAFDHTHQQFTDLLQRYVKEGEVDYARWRTERTGLDAYLQSLRSVCMSDMQDWNDAQRRAFWINTYNAFTIDLILSKYPVSSILRIGAYPTAAWKQKIVNVRAHHAKTLSLNQVEHDILRKHLLDARLHMALVCASVGCPPLRHEAYRADDLSLQLDDQSSRFVNDSSKNRFSEKENIFYGSKIFDWFKADFADYGGPKAFIRRYADIDLPPPEHWRLKSQDYDWSLNEAKSRPTP